MLPSVQNNLKGVFGVSRTRSNVWARRHSSLKKMPNQPPPTFMISKIITSVLVILPEMDEVHPRLTSYSEYLDTDKSSLVPQSGQKCRLHDILSAENGTNCNFTINMSKFWGVPTKPGNFFQSVTNLVTFDFWMFSSSTEILSGMITWKCKNYIQGQKNDCEIRIFSCLATMKLCLY